MRLQIVPTEYMSRWGYRLETNQYSVSEYTLGLSGQKGTAPSNDTATLVNDPFVDFSYDLSPIIMTVVQSPQVRRDIRFCLWPGWVGWVGWCKLAGAPHRTALFQASTRVTLSQFLTCVRPLPVPAFAGPCRVVSQAMLHFIVRLCAVVGGVLSITRMADRLVHAFLVASGMVVLPPSIKAKHRCEDILRQCYSCKAGTRDSHHRPALGYAWAVHMHIEGINQGPASTAVLKWSLLWCVAGRGVLQDHHQQWGRIRQRAQQLRWQHGPTQWQLARQRALFICRCCHCVQ